MCPQTPKLATIDYFLRIAYDGTNYGGWQRQANHPHTIQQTIEELLSNVIGSSIVVSGCGRTDAGVHASQFYLYFKSPKQLPQNFIFYINKHSPADIAFLEIIPVEPRARVCLDAEERTYDYFFHDFPDVWLARSSSRFDLSRFDPAATARILPLLLEHTDFQQFCITPKRHNSTIVRFSNATLFHDDDDTRDARKRFRIQFVANRFLRGMIRVLVRDLLKIGSGEMSPGRFKEMLDGSERSKSVRLAAPQGLFLTGVTYPYINRRADLPHTGHGDWQRV